MIYSMTMYYDEPEIIDLKIKEEAPYVDKIVIQESKWTHVGNMKPIRFNYEKYKNIKNIVHLIINNSSIYENCDIELDRFSRANAERRYPTSQLPIEDDDVLIVADSDEVINGDQIPRIVEETRKRGFVRLGMRAFYYYINARQAQDWSYAYSVTGEISKKFGLDWLRLHRAGIILPNCGNHFGWLGSAEKLQEKIQNMAHTEFNDAKIIAETQKRIDNLEDVVGRTDQGKLTIIEIDHLYPNTILNNYSEWKKYICKRKNDKL